MHAGIHGWEALFSHTEAAEHAGLMDAAGVYAPPLLVLLVIVFARTAKGNQEI